MAIPATYDEFLDLAKDAAHAIVPNAEITTQKVEKLQGESYVGLSVRPEKSNAAVTMNLRGMFEEVQKNPKRLAAVMSEFLSSLDNAIRNIPRINADRFLDYDYVKTQLTMQIIPVEPNRERLAQIPHKTIEDIAVVYRIDVSDDWHQNASTLVTNQMLAQFGITPSAAVAEAAIPACNLVCIIGRDARNLIQDYYEVLAQADLSSIGGSIPNDAFYYIGK